MATIEQTEVVVTMEKEAGEKVVSPGGTKRPSESIESELKSPAKKVARGAEEESAEVVEAGAKKLEASDQKTEENGECGEEAGATAPPAEGEEGKQIENGDAKTEEEEGPAKKTEGEEGGKEEQKTEEPAEVTPNEKENNPAKPEAEASVDKGEDAKLAVSAEAEN